MMMLPSRHCLCSMAALTAFADRECSGSMLPQQELESRLTRLLGKPLRAVRYYDIAYDHGLPGWNWWNGAFHNPDFGLELSLEGTDDCFIGWGSQFLDYNLFAYDSAAAFDYYAPRSYDVSGEAGWHSHLGQVIRQIRIFWSFWEDEGQKLWYPQDLELSFEDGSKVWMGAYLYMAPYDYLFPSGDELLVVFDQEAARKYCMGPYFPLNDDRHCRVISLTPPG